MGSCHLTPSYRRRQAVALYAGSSAPIKLTSKFAARRNALRYLKFAVAAVAAVELCSAATVPFNRALGQRVNLHARPDAAHPIVVGHRIDAVVTFLADRVSARAM